MTYIEGLTVAQNVLFKEHNGIYGRNQTGYLNLPITSKSDIDKQTRRASLAVAMYKIRQLEIIDGLPYEKSEIVNIKDTQLCSMYEIDTKPNSDNKRLVHDIFNYSEQNDVYKLLSKNKV